MESKFADIRVRNATTAVDTVLHDVIQKKKKKKNLKLQKSPYYIKLRRATLMDYLPFKLSSTFYHYFLPLTNSCCFFGYGFHSFTLAGRCCIHD